MDVPLIVHYEPPMILNAMFEHGIQMLLSVQPEQQNRVICPKCRLVSLGCVTTTNFTHNYNQLHIYIYIINNGYLIIIFCWWLHVSLRMSKLQRWQVSMTSSVNRFQRSSFSTGEWAPATNNMSCLQSRISFNTIFYSTCILCNIQIIYIYTI